MHLLQPTLLNFHFESNIHIDLSLLMPLITVKICHIFLLKNTTAIHQSYGVIMSYKNLPNIRKIIVPHKIKEL